MTHKFGNKDVNINHVLIISEIHEREGGDCFTIYFINGDTQTLFREDYPDLECERAIIIGKLNK